MEIYDGNSASATSLIKVCGEEIPLETFETSGNQAFVKYHGETDSDYKGFSLIYKTKGNLINAIYF